MKRRSRGLYDGIMAAKVNKASFSLILCYSYFLFSSVHHLFHLPCFFSSFFLFFYSFYLALSFLHPFLSSFFPPLTIIPPLTIPSFLPPFLLSFLPPLTIVTLLTIPSIPSFLLFFQAIITTSPLYQPIKLSLNA